MLNLVYENQVPKIFDHLESKLLVRRSHCIQKQKYPVSLGKKKGLSSLDQFEVCEEDLLGLREVR